MPDIAGKNSKEPGSAHSLSSDCTLQTFWSPCVPSTGAWSKQAHGQCSYSNLPATKPFKADLLWRDREQPRANNSDRLGWTKHLDSHLWFELRNFFCCIPVRTLQQSCVDTRNGGSTFCLAEFFPDLQVLQAPTFQATVPLWCGLSHSVWAGGENEVRS